MKVSEAEGGRTRLAGGLTVWGIFQLNTYVRAFLLDSDVRFCLL